MKMLLCFLICSSAFAQDASTISVFNNLQDANAGNYVLGPDFEGNDWATAAQFTPTSTVFLREVQALLGTGDACCYLNLAIAQDLAGRPGRILSHLLFEGTTPASPDSFIYLIGSYKCAACPVLLSGKPYWIIGTVTAAAAGQDGQEWAFSAVGITNITYNTVGTATGPWAPVVSSYTPLFAVLGVPLRLGVTKPPFLRPNN